MQLKGKVQQDKESQRNSSRIGTPRIVAEARDVGPKRLEERDDGSRVVEFCKQKIRPEPIELEQKQQPYLKDQEYNFLHCWYKNTFMNLKNQKLENIQISAF